jgi:hypothetical protein
MTKLDYNIDWSKYFQLSEESPSGLINLRDGRNAGNKQFNKNGDPKSWKVGFNYKDYCVHRIIWVITYGSIDPNLVIDHVDGNPFNNEINNLSLKSIADNSRNQYKFRNNTTGVTGVTLSKNNYIAHWQASDGKRKLKYFSLLKYGEKEAKILAIAYREQQIQRLISEGANYTDRHGTKVRIDII